eukprot:gene2217-2927_t
MYEEDAEHDYGEVYSEYTEYSMQLGAESEFGANEEYGADAEYGADLEYGAVVEYGDVEGEYAEYAHGNEDTQVPSEYTEFEENGAAPASAHSRERMQLEELQEVLTKEAKEPFDPTHAAAEARAVKAKDAGNDILVGKPSEEVDLRGTEAAEAISVLHADITRELDDLDVSTVMDTQVENEWTLPFFYMPWYSTFYETYAEGVFNPFLDSKTGTPTMSVCIGGSTPGVGSIAGGTNITLHLTGHLLYHRAPRIACQFGAVNVPASEVFTSVEGEVSVLCTSPPPPHSKGAHTVAVRLTVDHTTYTYNGPAFHYHMPFMIADDVEARYELSAAWEGFRISLPLRVESLAHRHIFAPYVYSALDEDAAMSVGCMVTCERRCKALGDRWVPGDYLLQQDRVVCYMPLDDVEEEQLVRVALDGQNPSEHGVWMRYDDDARELVATHRGRREASVTGPALNPPFAPAVEYLPFSPDYCVNFQTAQSAQLMSLGVSKGALHPEFNPDGSEYYVLLPRKDVGREMACELMAVAAPDAELMVDGRTVASGAGVRIPLHIGETKVEVWVTSMGGTPRVYTVIFYLLEDSNLEASLTSLVPSAGRLEPHFAAMDTGPYTVLLPASASSISFQAASLTGSPIRVCVVDADGDEAVSCESVSTEASSSHIALKGQSALIELEVEAADGLTYEVIVFRQGSARPRASRQLLSVPQRRLRHTVLPRMPPPVELSQPIAPVPPAPIPVLRFWLALRKQQPVLTPIPPSPIPQLKRWLRDRAARVSAESVDGAMQEFLQTSVDALAASEPHYRSVQPELESLRHVNLAGNQQAAAYQERNLEAAGQSPRAGYAGESSEYSQEAVEYSQEIVEYSQENGEKWNEYVEYSDIDGEYSDNAEREPREYSQEDAEYTEQRSFAVDSAVESAVHLEATASRWIITAAGDSASQAPISLPTGTQLAAVLHLGADISRDVTHDAKHTRFEVTQGRGLVELDGSFVEGMAPGEVTVQVTVGADWEGEWVCNINAPPGVVLVKGGAATSAVSGPALHVATVDIMVGNLTSAALVEGMVFDMHVKEALRSRVGTSIQAGRGFIKPAPIPKAKHALPSSHADRTHPLQRRKLPSLSEGIQDGSALEQVKGTAASGKMVAQAEVPVVTRSWLHAESEEAALAPLHARAKLPDKLARTMTPVATVSASDLDTRRWAEGNGSLWGLEGEDSPSLEHMAPEVGQGFFWFYHPLLGDSPWYGNHDPVWEFSDQFYPSVLPGKKDVDADLVRACIVGSSPVLGHASGGTLFTMRVTGQLTQAWLRQAACRFGDQEVLASGIAASPDGNTRITCRAPARTADTPHAVSVRLTLDGQGFTYDGPTFHYHTPFHLGEELHTVFSDGHSWEGFEVTVPLRPQRGHAHVFSPLLHAVATDTILAAVCVLDDHWVMGEIALRRQAVVCLVPLPLLDSEDRQLLRVSLDGRLLSGDGHWLRYRERQRKLESVHYSRELDSAPVALSGEFPVEYVPFSPDYCVTFRPVEGTALQSLHLSKGELFPPFDPDVEEYAVVVESKEAGDMSLGLTPTAAGDDSVIGISGVPVTSGQASRRQLRIGENKIPIEVVSGSRDKIRTYKLTVYVLASILPEGSLTLLATSVGLLEPPFDADSTGPYTVVVDPSVTSIAFKAVSVHGEPISCCSSNAPRLDECHTILSGAWSGIIPLQSGISLVELRVLSGNITYEVILLQSEMALEAYQAEATTVVATSHMDVGNAIGDGIALTSTATNVRTPINSSYDDVEPSASIGLESAVPAPSRRMVPESQYPMLSVLPQHRTITAAGDSASQAPISLPTGTQLAAVLHLGGGVSRDLTHDAKHTRFEVTQGRGLVELDGSFVEGMAPGEVTVRVTATNTTTGSAISTSVKLQVVVVETAYVQAAPYPVSAAVASTSVLKRVGCSSSWQRGVAQMAVELSDGRGADWEGEWVCNINAPPGVVLVKGGAAASAVSGPALHVATIKVTAVGHSVTTPINGMVLVMRDALNSIGEASYGCHAGSGWIELNAIETELKPSVAVPAPRMVYTVPMRHDAHHVVVQLRLAGCLSSVGIDDLGCRFGNVSVGASLVPSVGNRAAESAVVECVAPPVDADGEPSTVTVQVTLDGRLYTPSGPLFFYHAPFAIGLGVQSRYLATGSWEGFQLALPLVPRGVNSLIETGSAKRKPAFTAGCVVGSQLVWGEYDPLGRAVICEVPLIYLTAGQVVMATLDGRQLSDNAVHLQYVENVGNRSLAVARFAASKASALADLALAQPQRPAPVQPMEDLPFSPTLCVEAAELVGLSELEVFPGQLSPAFDPEWYAYYVLLEDSAAAANFTMSLRTAALGASVLAAGSPVENGQRIAPRLTLGHNVIPVEVVSGLRDWKTRYTVVVYVCGEMPEIESIPEDMGTEELVPSAALSGLRVSVGELYPPFDPEVRTYDVLLDEAQGAAFELGVTPVAVERGAAIKLAGEVRRSGRSYQQPLLPGTNLVEIEVESATEGSRTYQVHTHVLTEEMSLGALVSIVPSEGELAPRFDSRVHGPYSVLVQDSAASISFRAVSVTGALISVCGTSSQMGMATMDKCHITASGDSSTDLALLPGLNLVELWVSQAHVAYQVMVYRPANFSPLPPLLSKMARSSEPHPPSKFPEDPAQQPLLRTRQLPSRPAGRPPAHPMDPDAVLPPRAQPQADPATALRPSPPLLRARQAATTSSAMPPPTEAVPWASVEELSEAPPHPLGAPSLEEPTTTAPRLALELEELPLKASWLDEEAQDAALYPVREDLGRSFGLLPRMQAAVPMDTEEELPLDFVPGEKLLSYLQRGAPAPAVKPSVSWAGREHQPLPDSMFYASDGLFEDHLYSQAIFYTHFYGPMYDFYTSFYDHRLESAERAPSGEMTAATLSACIVGSTPTAGPSTGGTVVTLHVAGHILPEQTPFVQCRFGEEGVPTEKVSISSEGAVEVHCRAPPRHAEAPHTVAVRLSVDGRLFTHGGAYFHYHAPFQMGEVHVRETNAGKGGTREVVVPLSVPAVHTSLFAPFMYSMPEELAVSAACLVACEQGCARGGAGERWVPARFLLAEEQVVCELAPEELDVEQLVRVSLDGQTASSEGVWLRFDRGARLPVPAGMAQSLPPQRAGTAPSFLVDYLPFSVEHCVQFGTAEAAALLNLELSAGQLEPRFSKDVYEYHTVVGTAESHGFAVTPTPASWGAAVTVAGEPGASGERMRVPLRVGANRVPVQVTAEDGEVMRTYVLMAYVLGEAAPEGTLTRLQVSEGELEPPFEAKHPGPYTAVVDRGTERIAVMLASLADLPTSVCSTAAGREHSCVTVESATWSDELSLDFGVNELVLQPEPGGLVYTLLVFRPTSAESFQGGRALLGVHAPPMPLTTPPTRARAPKTPVPPAPPARLRQLLAASALRWSWDGAAEAEPLPEPHGNGTGMLGAGVAWTGEDSLVGGRLTAARRHLLGAPQGRLRKLGKQGRMPVLLTVTAQHPVITVAGDGASFPPVLRPTATPLTVSLRFTDGTCSDLSEDARARFAVLQGADVARMEGACVVGKGAPGMATVQVTLAGFTPAANLSGVVTVYVVRLEAVNLEARPYPPFQGSHVLSLRSLRRVHCTSQWQRAAMSMTAVLSDGSEHDVTQQARFSSKRGDIAEVAGGGVLVPMRSGKAVIMGAFADAASSYLVIRIEEDVRAMVAGLEQRTRWQEGGTLAGEWGTQQRLAVRVVFDDGTEFPDVVGGVPWMAAGELLRFESSAEEAVRVDAQGVALLLGNHHRAVEITAVAVACFDGGEAEAAAARATDRVYANLEPSIGDVDLGQRRGLQFPASSEGEVLQVEVRVNSMVGALLQYEMEIYMDDEHLTVQECTQGADWEGEWPSSAWVQPPSMKACIIGASAAAGHDRGGKTMLLRVQTFANLSAGTRSFACHFGPVQVAASVHSGAPEAEAVVACEAPPRPPHGARAVHVRMTVDGVDHTHSGPVFHYHAPFNLRRDVHAAYTLTPSDWEGFRVALPLLVSGPLFTLAVSDAPPPRPAPGCLYGNAWIPGELHLRQATVVCHVELALLQPSAVLRASVDAHWASDDGFQMEYDPLSQTLVPAQHLWDLPQPNVSYAAGESMTEAVEPLAFSPDLCVGGQAAPGVQAGPAGLGSVVVAGRVLAFDVNRTDTYVALQSECVPGGMVNVTPIAAWGHEEAPIRLLGVPVLSQQNVLMRLEVGLNELLFEVDDQPPSIAPARTFHVGVYLLALPLDLMLASQALTPRPQRVLPPPPRVPPVGSGTESARRADLEDDETAQGAGPMEPVEAMEAMVSGTEEDALSELIKSISGSNLPGLQKALEEDLGEVNLALGMDLPGDRAVSFYDPVWAMPFYGGFYEMPEAVPETRDLGEAPAVTSVCILGSSPAMGPDAGGTVVTLLFSGHVLPSGAARMACKFGEEPARAARVVSLPTGESRAECTAPARRPGGARMVAVRLSLDGELYTFGGPEFHYHAPFGVVHGGLRVAPALAEGWAGGFQISLLLTAGSEESVFSPLLESVWPDMGSSTLCLYGDAWVPAEFSLAQRKVICHIPEQLLVTDALLRVSLDGQVASRDGLQLWYDRPKRHLVPYAHEYDLPPVTSPDSGAGDVTYLPFSPDLCLTFSELSPLALASLQLTAAQLRPEFHSEVFEYTALVYEEDAPGLEVEIFPEPVDTASSVMVSGQLLGRGEALRQPLRAGRNRFPVEVVSTERMMVRVYIVTVYLLTRDMRYGVLTHLSLSAAALDPPFDVANPGPYSAVVGRRTELTELRAAAMTDANVRVCISSLEMDREETCATLAGESEGGTMSMELELGPGVNLCDVQPQPGGRSYELLIFRPRDDEAPPPGLSEDVRALRVVHPPQLPHPVTAPPINSAAKRIAVAPVPMPQLRRLLRYELSREGLEDEAEDAGPFGAPSAVRGGAATVPARHASKPPRPLQRRGSHRIVASSNRAPSAATKHGVGARVSASEWYDPRRMCLHTERSPTAVSASTQHSDITIRGDAAEIPPLSLPSETSLFVVMHYDDGACVDFSNDPRTHYALGHGGEHAELTGSAVMGKNTSGSVNVTVGFTGYNAAHGLHSHVGLRVLAISALRVAARPYPPYPGSAAVELMSLRQIQCARNWQRAQVEVLAELSHGEVVDVSAYAALVSNLSDVVTVEDGGVLVPVALGVGTITAGFGVRLRGSLQMEVSHEVAAIASVELHTKWSVWDAVSFVAQWGTQKRMSVSVDFADGTRIADVARDAPWIPMYDLLTFRSSHSDKIAVDNHGVAALLDNHHRPVALSVDTACTPAVGTEARVYANLEPAPGDLDLGQRYGVQFPAAAFGEVLRVEVRVGQGSPRRPITRFEARLDVNPEQLLATVCHRGEEWAGAWDCNLDDPARVQIRGHSPIREVRGEALHVATVEFMVQDGAGPAVIGGAVQTKGTLWAPMLAGHGVVELNRQRTPLLPWTAPQAPLEAWSDEEETPGKKRMPPADNWTLDVPYDYESLEGQPWEYDEWEYDDSDAVNEAAMILRPTAPPPLNGLEYFETPAPPANRTAASQAIAWEAEWPHTPAPRQSQCNIISAGAGVDCHPLAALAVDIPLCECRCAGWYVVDRNSTIPGHLLEQHRFFDARRFTLETARMAGVYDGDVSMTLTTQLPAVVRPTVVFPYQMVTGLGEAMERYKHASISSGDYPVGHFFSSWLPRAFQQTGVAFNFSHAAPPPPVLPPPVPVKVAPRMPELEQLASKFYDFYGSEILFDLMYEQFFYDSIMYSPFYGPFYEFYSDFYDPLPDEVVLVDAAAPRSVMSVCLIASGPTVGPITGGTRVVLQASGNISPQHLDSVRCQFGSEVVAPDGLYTTVIGTNTLECISPPRPPGGPQSVAVRLTLDGEEYTYDGAPFHYHAAFHIRAEQAHVRFLASHDWEGFEVAVPLAAEDGFERIFGLFLYGMQGGEGVTVGASCLYGNLWVRAEFSLQLEQVTCHVDLQDARPAQLLRVTLDGEHVSSDAVELRWERESNVMTVEEHAWELPQPEHPPHGGGLEFLPFSPDYCVYFNTVDSAALASLAVSAGKLQPHFDPQVHTYHIVLQAEEAEQTLKLTPTAEDLSAAIVVAGHGTLSGQPVAVDLRLGENMVVIQVTSGDQKLARTYVVHIYLLLEHMQQGTLNSIQVSGAGIDPEFDSESSGPYSAVVSAGQKFVYVRATSLIEANISVCVTNREAESECYSLRSGKASPPLGLSAGVSLFEVQAVFHGVPSGFIYEVLIFRAPVFDEARPIIRLTSSSPGFRYGTVEYSDLHTFAQTFTAFNNLPPGTDGNVKVVVGANDACSSGDISATSNSFTASAEDVAVVSAVIRTVELYSDASEVSAHYTVRDAAGRPQVALTDLVVQLMLTLVDDPGSAITVTCGVPSESTGAGDCTDDGASLTGWFSDADVVYVEAHVVALYGSTTVAQGDPLDVNLHPKVSHSRLEDAGMVAGFAESPRFVGSEISSEVRAHTGGFPLISWQIRVAFSTSLFGDTVVYTVTSKYNPETFEESGYLTVGASGTATDVTDEEVTSDSLYLATLTLTVQDVVSDMSGSQTWAMYTDVYSIMVEEMVNTGGNRYVAYQAAQVDDSQGGAQTAASLIVKRDALVDIYAYPYSAELFNTAFLNSAVVTSAITAMGVYNRYDKQDIELPSAMCSIDTAAGAIASLDDCSVQLTSNQTAGADGVVVTVGYDTFSVSVPLRVWFPEDVYIRAQDTTLSRIAGLYDHDACSRPRYQKTQLTALAVFGGTGLNSTEPLDVTCTVTFQVHDTDVLSLIGSAVIGAKNGTSAISISSGAATLTASTEVTVTEELVGVSHLDAVLITSASWVGVSDVTLNPRYQMGVLVTLLQELEAEGDHGFIVAYATYSDGTYTEVRSADGLQISVNAAYTASLEVTQDSEARFVGTVPEAAASIGAEDVLQAAWVDSCTSATVASGQGPVNVTLSPPSSVAITAQYSLITFSGDGASYSPISKPTASQLSITMTYEDGTSKDLTDDARADYSVTAGSEVLSLGGSVVYANTATGEGTVTVTFPTYSGAETLSASITISVVELSSVSITAQPYPSYTNSDQTLKTVLRRVQCTSAYQRATGHITAELSDASTYDVTSAASFSSGATGVISISSGNLLVSVSAGTADVTGTFAGASSASLSMQVTDSVAAISAVVHQTGWSSSSTFADAQGSTKALAIQLSFDDATQFPDVISSVEWIAVSELLQLASSVSSTIQLSDSGTATLLDNHFAAVELTATALCGTGEVTALPSATEEVYANLEPLEGDVDLGSRYGLQFAAATSGDLLSVEMRINSVSSILIDFQVTVYFDAAHLTATGCTQGDDWTDIWVCTLNSPVDQVQVAGSDVLSTVQGSALTVALMSFAVSDVASTSSIQGVVEVMTTEATYPDGVKNYPVVAGGGSVQLNGGGAPSGKRHLLQARRRPLQAPPPPSGVYLVTSGIHFSNLAASAFSDSAFYDEFSANFKAQMAAAAGVDVGKVEVTTISDGSSVHVESTVEFPWGSSGSSSADNFITVLELDVETFVFTSIYFSNLDADAFADTVFYNEFTANFKTEMGTQAGLDVSNVEITAISGSPVKIDSTVEFGWHQYQE